MLRFATLACPVASVLMALGLSPLVARAELPPWVYGERQRRAPLVVQLRVLQAQRSGGEARVRGQVLQVWRQPRTTSLKPGQAIEVRYSLPPERAPGWVGPSSLSLPGPGDAFTAWLLPIDGSSATFAPAAGGRSFGPALEGVKEP